ncbi:hypothetical protein [Fervidobacterium thailandense]|uniref:Uncharacterized protein n=1 Tax=Fervidobacterium thailandense TaxID=1008305 RepID=A0A1E3G2Y3_9BACT|nr:hypothetical protein [Fervidobacterium thailandense]ODN30510.1 hypothetical protein A4H02_04430 [Fervidobacterium thailandense]
MSDFERLSEILKPYAEILNTKIWLCEKIGKRLSCIARAGEETYSESYVVYEDQKYVLFAERELSDDEKVKAEEIIRAVEKARG